ncbi:hypothetical protein [Aquabacterium sp. OR-4]|uniref:hypothetical protein n=1 Tax=Aquabacterium sp. OR-4 TaxID=2978127 RepID=UPI0028C69E85|nr:hypothetical protein [Aquabacterium sp. OR-4]MDT7835041.1 hypothetical protein [Aquabacterium sp. OR-4]
MLTTIDWLLPLLALALGGGLIHRYWRLVAQQGADDALPDPVLMALLQASTHPHGPAPRG